MHTVFMTCSLLRSSKQKMFDICTEKLEAIIKLIDGSDKMNDRELISNQRLLVLAPTVMSHLVGLETPWSP